MQFAVSGEDVTNPLRVTILPGWLKQQMLLFSALKTADIASYERTEAHSKPSCTVALMDSPGQNL